MDEQDHDSFFNIIVFKNIGDQIPIAINQARPSKK